MKAASRLWTWLRPAPDPVGRHRSLLVYAGGYYLKLALLLCGVSILLYVLHDPPEGPSGSTWLGYTLGCVGAALILWLAWYGVRKRRYRESRAPAQAWVSAHVYLGLSLLLVATLHGGFQFGWNVHTLAYALMVIVILSGVYGIVVYARLPRALTANRDQQMEFRAMLDEIARLNQFTLTLADRIDPETHAMVARSVGRVRIGGSAWEQLSGRYRVPGELGALEGFVARKRAQLEAQSARLEALERSDRSETIAFVADQMFSSRSERGGESLQKLLQAIARRKALLERINRDITLRARLTVWLYLHVPLTVTLLAALLVHVLSVFLYW